MKYYCSSLIALALAATTAGANAQDAGQAPADQNSAQPAQPDKTAPPTTPAPDTDAPPAAAAPSPQATPGSAQPAPEASASAQASTQVSDQEVDQFAQATVKVQAINADAKLDEKAKQTQMADAVKETGLDPARYNDIAKAVASDTALRTRVQTAMAKYAKPTPKS
jgi:hypothetical protein